MDTMIARTIRVGFTVLVEATHQVIQPLATLVSRQRSHFQQI